MNPSERRRFTLAAAGFLAGAATTEFAKGKHRNAHRFGAAAATAFLVPTLLRNCTWWGPVKKTFAAKENEVWLTIDDGPDPTETPRILDVLREFDARATFFCIGRRVNARPDLARAMVDAGHDVQNHTFSHSAFTFWAATPRRAAREIELGSEAIRQATGREPSLFRAPAGLGNAFVHAAAARARLRMVGWSAAGRDGIAHDPEEVLRRILGNIRPGSIILLHENRLAGMAAGQRSRTLERLLAGIDQLQLRTTLPQFQN